MVKADVSVSIYRGGERRPDGSRVKLRGSYLEGVARYTLDRPASTGDQLVFLDFASFLREFPKDLDEVKLATYIDGPFDAGELRLLVYWGASDIRRVGERRDIVVSLQPGTQTLTVRYSVDIPHRYWPFGCVRRRCSLSGAIAPLPSEPAQGGRHLPPGRVIAPVHWTVSEAEFATPGGVRPGAKSPKKGGRPREKRRPDEVVVAGGDGRVIHYPSIYWGPRWNRVRRYHAGVEVEVLHPYFRPGSRAPNEYPVQLYRDVAGHAALITQEIVELLGAVGREPKTGSKLTIIQGPLRSSVAEHHPGVVVISDQAMELFPYKRFLKFHQDAIARSVLDAFLLGQVAPMHSGSEGLWVPGAMALALLQVWRQAREYRDEFASDLLRNFTFVPAVDRFLYTQQASFSQTYFRGVEDQPPLRNHPLWFSHAVPTGRRIHEKLSDQMGAAKMGELYKRVLEDPRRDFQREAEAAHGYTLDWFFDQWLGPYPSVDYLIADVQSRREGKGWRHEITIERRGERPVIEPVQLLVVERSGQRHYLLWNGETEPGAPEGNIGRHTFSIYAHGKIKYVSLDPQKRLLQHPQKPRDNVDPLFNDRRPAQFRFLYTGAGFSIAASELFTAATPAAAFNAVSGFVSFESSLRRDLRRTGHVIVARDRESHVSVGAGTNFWFGRKVNNQRRRSRVRFFVTTSYLSERTLDPRGGVRITERLSLIDDTRRFSWWPERGTRVGVGVMARQTVRVEAGQSDDRFDLAADVGWTQLWPIAHDHVIATLLGAELEFPLASDPEFRSLPRVGGIGGLSGYLADEVFSRGIARLQVEYRHVFLSNMRINLLHAGFLRSIGGVAFAGTATASGCDSLGGWFGADSWYGHVGYGLTAYLSILGVTPQLFRLDASVPLVRRQGTGCLGETFPNYLAQRQGIEDANVLLPPFNINVTFNHAF